MNIMGWDPNGAGMGSNDIVSANPDIGMPVPALVSGNPDVACTGQRAGTLYDRRWRRDHYDCLGQGRGGKQCKCQKSHG